MEFIYVLVLVFIIVWIASSMGLFDMKKNSHVAIVAVALLGYVIYKSPGILNGPSCD